MYNPQQEKLLKETTNKLLNVKEIPTAFDRAAALVDELHRAIPYHDYFYYVKSAPKISDYDYDKLFKLLKELESTFPELITPASPSQRMPVGLTKDFPPVEHLVPMLSLDNSYDENDLRDFDKRIKQIVGNREIEYCAEPKFDGASISLVYENNHYIRGASRGDGAVGEDITPNLRTLRSLPLNADFSKEGISLIEVRGEVLIRKNIFQKMNEQRIEEGLPPLANPRNSASGSLRLQDPKEVAKRNLEAFLYQVSYVEGEEDNLLFRKIKTHSNAMNLLAAKGFRTPDDTFKLCRGIDEVIAYCNEWEQKRDSYPYELDGIVIKVNEFSLQEELGRTSHHPRWAMAFKFKAKQAKTKLIDVVFQIGRVGTITPVARLAPVELAGVTVSSASMFNQDFITEKDIRIGDTVLVERAGDVIPYIAKVVEEERTGKEKEVVFPTECPSCSSGLVKPEDEAALRCININCPAQVVERLKLFVSKDAMDMAGFGAANVKKFHDLGIISSIPDIYRMDYDEIQKLEGFGEKSIENLKKAVETAKHRPLTKLIFGLGIRHVGQTTARNLSEEVKCITDFKDWDVEKLSSLKDIGPKVAASIHEFFSNEENLKMIEELKEMGVEICHPEGTAVSDGKFTGQVFLFTGSLQKFSRSQAQAIVEEHGGKVASGISAKVNYLVAGADAGSKLDKAKKIPTVNIISEDDFLEMVEN